DAPCLQRTNIVTLTTTIVENTTVGDQQAVACKRLHGCGETVTSNRRSMSYNVFLAFARLLRCTRFYNCVINDLNTVGSQPIFPLLLMTNPLAIPKKSPLFECRRERRPLRSTGMLSRQQQFFPMQYWWIVSRSKIAATHLLANRIDKARSSKL